MVARYAHANGNHIDAAMDKLEDRLTLAKSTQGGSISSEITPKLHRNYTKPKSGFLQL
jgi:hypothetical protein